MARAGYTKRSRSAVRLVLDSQLVRRPLWLEQSARRNLAANRFDVLLVRLSAGTLDDDGLVGAMKGVRDEVAAWIGLDDADDHIGFRYLQEPCRRGTHAVRVEITDQEDPNVERRRVVGPSVAIPLPLPKGGARRPRGRGALSRMGADEPGACRGCGTPVSLRDGGRRGDRPARPAAPVEQRPLAFMKSIALLPWDQEPGAEPTVTELEALTNVLEPPELIHVRVPVAILDVEIQGRPISIGIDRHGRLELRRHRYRHPYFGDCFLYLAEGDRPEAFNAARKDDRR
jgi:hypothetical protein